MRSGRIVVFGALAAALLAGYAHTTRADDSKHHKQYSDSSLHGAYASQFSGTVLTNNGALPLGGTGVFIADGKGNITGHESYEFNGTPCNATVSGTYAVAADGSGTNSLKFTTSDPGCQGGSYTQSFAIAQSGHTIVLANSNQGQAIDEVWRAQK